MRIAIAESATVFRHKQLIAMHASLAACVIVMVAEKDTPLRFVKTAAVL